MAEGAGGGGEEQFVLRVTDEGLASRLRTILREEASLRGSVELSFSGRTRSQAGLPLLGGGHFPCLKTHYRRAAACTFPARHCGTVQIIIVMES